MLLALPGAAEPEFKSDLADRPLTLRSAADPESDVADRSFKKFAASWIKQIAADAEAAPKAALGGARTIVRRAGAEFSTKLQETGKPGAPYVGMLSYIEHVYSCSGPASNECEIVESTPVTEIFPFHGGEWKY